ncbi:hypothetical protein DPMN_018146 [Dreissena polymorpha]|uniref:Uncharacterized protein n=1 Tax=Dreissena polymorpha TaxID=45954 RepID=A0A9D4L9I4_DREPO|nr:hypothetical protein DPMN_095525 [Dreissena polymorpha]KAH3889513.1 hypothetical protein DPMN_013570 [Dreissena polymorpha]KAH3893991.1 hypothetical protein DPMN_018146 [Dreissena polymorpha]
MEFRANKRIKLSSQKGPSPLDLARTYCQNYVDPPGFEVKTVNDVIGEGVFATKPFKKRRLSSRIQRGSDNTSKTAIRKGV